ncbi:MAG TPA: tRNA uridine(34) 5-carboxymethylaminomethyl modification radical SAM/GNAT enzyme Elp3 [Candidatus Thermoplasmatota archaeon]|nr:tRNA uridine(34) 5-carboxymethylaminomethyl modification radical SAM/GNAT enzyme Elp3 [Candidatus Thermoplasmatota archaeon]
MATTAAFARRILDGIAAGEIDREKLQNAKLALAAELRVGRIPSNADVLAHATQAERALVEPVLRVRPTRSISGVTIVTVQSSPEACPHGKCTYCPGGPEFGTAQSYTGDEPAARRAARWGFDPYGQTSGRLTDLRATGHPVDKVDFIVQGGTFTARDVDYQRWFVQRAFDALNAVERPEWARSASLEEAQARNESAASRMIGLTIETKPDWARPEDVDLSLALGCTRYELGVQTVFDEVLRVTHRGHTMRETYAAFAAVKDAGLKLCAHVMPGQPGSTREMDLETFRQLFQDPRLAPDMVKIYPTLVVAGTSLHKQWQAGKYRPLSDEEAADLVAEAKRLVPRWARIQRVDRDIPTPRIEAGVRKLNLRELVLDRLAREGRKCACIRCREAGHVANKEGRAPRALALTRAAYPSAGGREHFLAVEDVDEDILVGFVRLREPSPAAWRPEVEDALLLRELKVFGNEVPIGERRDGAHQHQGHGARLVAEAEDLARALGRRRVVVTAGVGVRPYYAKLGYARLGPYMAKDV